MILTLVNVLYVLIAVAMVALILLQRGAGASAGSGFGAGASATVFGSRGASNFLSKSTAILAALFFALSLGMAMYATKSAQSGSSETDLGVMGDTSAVPSGEVPPAPAISSDAATAPSEVPAAPAATAAPSDVPAAPATTSEAAPAEAADKDDNGG